MRPGRRSKGLPNPRLSCQERVGGVIRTVSVPGRATSAHRSAAAPAASADAAAVATRFNRPVDAARVRPYPKVRGLVGRLEDDHREAVLAPPDGATTGHL